MARPRFHALATVPFAWLAYRRWGPAGALGLAGASILVDFDHLADYLWVRMGGQRTHFFAPLHAWELVAVGGALVLWARSRPDAWTAPPGADGKDRCREFVADDEATTQALLTGVVAGLVLHLVQDVLTNRPSHAGVYALTYRWAHRFRRDRIGWKDHQTFHDWSGKPWYTWF
jgi:hypothetical protein